MSERKPKPPWLRIRFRPGENYRDVGRVVSEGGLHTVCESALCPNRAECWEQRTATFMILGGVCTRSCGFCAVGRGGRPGPPDEGEPERVALAVGQMGLAHAVVTSVTRDDLPDGGARLWAETVRVLRARCPGCGVEVLAPDFGGRREDQDEVLATRPDVFGHNLETASSLYATVRPGADYGRSLALLARAAAAGLVVKTGIMVGLGETRGEVEALMGDAAGAGVSLFTIGQYLRPGPRHLPVSRYVTPGEFEELAGTGLGKGLRRVLSGPLVRSSYHARAQADADHTPIVS